MEGEAEVVGRGRRAVLTTRLGNPIMMIKAKTNHWMA